MTRLLGGVDLGSAQKRGQLHSMLLPPGHVVQVGNASDCVCSIRVLLPPSSEFPSPCPMYTRKSVSRSISPMQYACSSTGAYPCAVIQGTPSWSLRRSISTAKTNKNWEYLFHILCLHFFDMTTTPNSSTLLCDFSLSSWPYPTRFLLSTQALNTVIPRARLSEAFRRFPLDSGLS